MDAPWRSLTEATKSVAKRLGRIEADLTALGVQRAALASDGREPLTPAPEEAPLSRVLQTLDSIPTLVGYLRSRRREPLLTLEDEAAVQDLLYFGLKPLLPDLVYEEPTRKGAAGYNIGDFSLMAAKLILEVKYVKASADVRAKANEIAQDILQYSAQTDCKTIVFFVYDPHQLIPDRPNFIQQSSGEFAWQGRQVIVYTVIKP